MRIQGLRNNALLFKNKNKYLYQPFTIVDFLRRSVFLYYQGVEGFFLGGGGNYMVFKEIGEGK